MEIMFYKYQGTGNDFVMIDNREKIFDKNNLNLVKRICDRKFGVGADGLILIENHDDLDFNMVYFNADGSQSFCGNGSRCAVAFAKYLDIIEKQTFFWSTDGEHEAWIDNNGKVSLKMHDVENIEKGDNYFFINTGSPHYIVYKDNIDNIDVVEEGRKVRYNKRFKEEGTNVNFLNNEGEQLYIRTYERGVEDETLSCGTGVTASAISKAVLEDLPAGKIKVNTLGGLLEVGFRRNINMFNDIWLIGPATYVFKGEISIER